MDVTSSPIALLLATGGVAAAVAYAAWIYRSRELAVRGRLLLGGLRAGALAVVVLLLLDPQLPGPAAVDGEDWILLDASESMAVGEPTPWSRALDAVRTRSGDLHLYGEDEPRRVLGPLDSLPGPTLRASRLAPALRRAAEAGARRVTVVSDLRLEDAAAAAATAVEMGLEVEVVDVGRPLFDVGVASFDLPPAVDEGEGVDAVVTVFAVVPAGDVVGRPDSFVVEIREEGRPVASERIALPDAGRLARLEVELPPPTSPGSVRYTASVYVPEGASTEAGGDAGSVSGGAAPDDAWEADDVRVAYTRVAPVEGALVLVSSAPDWEPRFLLPVLSRATGLAPRGFLGVGGDRWVATEATGEGPRRSAEIGAVAVGAELLVVQGGPEGIPGWLEDAARGVRRLLLLPGGGSTLPSTEWQGLAGIDLEGPRAGEWYASEDPPSSPIAGAIAGVRFGDLPPVGPVLAVSGAARGSVPLVLRHAGSEETRPALLLAEGEGRRRAVLLASGTWRWALRGGEPREAYRRLWSGVVGWLMAEAGEARTLPRPVPKVVARGEAIRWAAGAVAGEEIALTILRGEAVDAEDERSRAEAVLDTVVSVPDSGRLTTPSLPPGTYRYVVGPAAESGAEGGGTGATEEGADGAGAGRFDVEGWSVELRHPRVPAFGEEGGAAAPEPGREAGSGADTVRERRGADGGRPLRTHPAPYLVVLVLLSVEWIGRRRLGLR